MTFSEEELKQIDFKDGEVVTLRVKAVSQGGAKKYEVVDVQRQTPLQVTVKPRKKVNPITHLKNLQAADAGAY